MTSAAADSAGVMEIYAADTADLLDSQQRDPLLRFLTDVIVAHARRVAPGGGTVLDVGCGVGRTSMALARAGFRVDGVDPSQRAVELAGEEASRNWAAPAAATATGPPRFAVGDATAGLPDERHGRYDVVVCSEVLEHVLVPSAVVRYCHDALKPGGWLILTTPHQRSQWTVMDTYAGHVTRFEVGEVEALLAPGFGSVRVETEGFPFQRAVMKLYDARVERSGQRHEFAGIRDRPAYRAYVHLMPVLLKADHFLRGMRRGTTIVAVASRRP